MARLPCGHEYPYQDESGRTCGCDPKLLHVCPEHAAHVDNSEVEVCEGVEFLGGDRSPCGIVVTGPDDDGEIGILATDVLYLNRFAAEALAVEILRRVQTRGGRE